MPKMVSLGSNVLLEINLIKNDKVDFKKGRDDFENWIPFEFNLNIENECYIYPIEFGAMLNVFELKNIISKIEKIILLKSDNQTFEKVGISCIERYFEMEIYDTLEYSQIYIDLWIPIGILTNGETLGYEKGFRFVISLDSLKDFKNEFRGQASQYLN